MTQLNTPTTETICVVGACFAGGQRREGVDRGPQYLRDSGLSRLLIQHNWEVEDLGDVSAKTYADGCDEKDLLKETGINSDKHFRAFNADQVSAVCKELHGLVSQQAKQGKFVLTLGGDHSIAMGSIGGILESRPDTAVIWVDAHADINTPYISLTGSMHGMPVSFLMGLEGTEMPQFDWIKNKLSPSRIAYIGLRDVDEAETEILSKLNIAAFTMSDVRRLGIKAVMEQAFAAVQNESRTRPVHLSFDIDGLDIEEAPSTGTAVAGGLTLEEGCYIAQFLNDSHTLTSLDLVEVNPALCHNPSDVSRTVTAALSVIEHAIQKERGKCE